jgi:hypothetical protein
MDEKEWQEERAQLLEDLNQAKRIALESQAKAAVYLDLLENCNKAARQARDSGDVKFLNSVEGNLMFYATPQEGEEWGRYFLNAYKRDANWLEDTKKALEQIKADAERFLEDNEVDPELEVVLKRIIAAADNGLVLHLD